MIRPTLALATLFTLIHCGGDAPATQTPIANDASSGGIDSGDGSSPCDGGASCQPAACPKTSQAKVAAKLSFPEASEVSGLAVSSKNPGIYWMHNDSGDSARVFAVTAEGARRASISFDTAKPTDIEDMAIEDDASGKSYLYFADIGDNNSVRTELTIHRVEEPLLAASDNVIVATSEKMTVVYSNGAHNAETFLFDSITKDLLIATKKPGGPSEIHRIGKFAAGTKATTEKIATVAIDLATGGEISRDGTMIGIRNYTTAGFLWKRKEGESLASVFSRAPCTIPISTEVQGETLAFSPDGKGYFTISEGAGAELHSVSFE